jgi:hypothetical protein
LIISSVKWQASVHGSRLAFRFGILQTRHKSMMVQINGKTIIVLIRRYIHFAACAAGFLNEYDLFSKVITFKLI